VVPGLLSSDQSLSSALPLPGQTDKSSAHMIPRRLKFVVRLAQQLNISNPISLSSSEGVIWQIFQASHKHVRIGVACVFVHFCLCDLCGSSASYETFIVTLDMRIATCSLVSPLPAFSPISGVNQSPVGVFVCCESNVFNLSFPLNKNLSSA
jgi:hypothetical protein